jgi:hypothetical protein
MKNQKMYEADDKMISIIRDNYNILQNFIVSASMYQKDT